MARTEANLTTFTLASDYDPIHYNWTKNELAVLGDCKATAEVIKARLEANGLNVNEMYVIEHSDTDGTKTHYHILVKFEEKQGATLKKIAEYIGVPFPIVIKLDPGRYSYPNSLAYLIHIKNMDKIQYAPEVVVTLAGADYMVHYNKYKEGWIKARDIVAKKGGKSLKRLLREAMAKMETGEISYSELRGIKEYRKLLFEPKYAQQLKRKNDCVIDVARKDYSALLEKIKSKEITSLDEITTSEDWKLAYKYHKYEIDSNLRAYTNN